MTTTEYQNGQIATACWRAAQNNLHQVMLSVLMVFLNRAEAESKDLYEVVTEWLAENPTPFPDTRDPQFQQFLSRMETVITKLVPDKTGGALWFVPKDQLTAGMLEAFQETTRIGSLIFIKEK